MIRAELYRHDEPETPVAVAVWEGGRFRVEPVGEVAAGLDAIFRPTPVVVDDASLRPIGSHGEVTLSPGSLEWFRAALLARAPALGLGVRFVADRIENGWDPAANYRTFQDQVRRLANG